MNVKIINLNDDLHRLVGQINNASWDRLNEMSKYSVVGLKAFLQRQDTLFIACYEGSESSSVLYGIASSRVEIKPYAKALWLYVDELDVCSDQRRKGAASFIMKTLIEIAGERGCHEVWLGTEADNLPANALYRSLGPDEEAKVMAYTYRNANCRD